MIRVFARKETTQKVAIFAPSNAKRDVAAWIMLSLKQQYGGDWVCVQTLKPDEVLIFSDTLVYKGYETGVTQYCSFLDRLSPPTDPGTGLAMGQAYVAPPLKPIDEATIQLLVGMEEKGGQLASLILELSHRFIPDIADKLANMRTKHFDKEDYDNRFKPFEK